ncbi:hypothetical protein LTR78_006690 [Recurvomyces mirabilis]|uniref:Uncharacterized protein n=1 Tax=Recurvomyces mirabilis TaxID=574656 RepID=A0AAE0WKL8_9PEZI|nr:hypothetical protein LTR78_006690 [Recurvomyces mirabilis]KAK5151421.1 hypothetical protein LTS14_009264 [Recurvomyces mirabilis]
MRMKTSRSNRQQCLCARGSHIGRTGKYRAGTVHRATRLRSVGILSDPPAFVTEAVQHEARRDENRRKVYAKMAAEAERSELWDSMAQSGRDSGTIRRRVEADPKRALTGTAKDELIDDVRRFAGYRR